MIGRTNAFSGSNLVQLNTPENLSITGTTLSWSAVGNAEHYVVYSNGSIFDTVDTNSCSLASLTTVGTYVLQVVATAEGYANSIKSASVTYSYNQLITPTGLSRSGNNLTWNAVAHATTYLIFCDEIVGQHWTTSTTSIDMASILTTSGTYTLRVMARASGYADSDYSAPYAWQGGTQYFSVSVRRTDSDNDPPYVEVKVNGQTTLLYYDDSASFTGVVGSGGLSLQITYPATGYSRQTRWSYSFSSGQSDSGITTNQDYTTSTFTISSSVVIDVSYVYTN